MRGLPVAVGAITCGGLAGALFGAGRPVAGAALIAVAALALLWSMVAVGR